LDTSTVRRILRRKLKESQITRTRWVLTWTPQENGPDGAKARLVVLGYQDPDLDTVPKDAPTLTKHGRSALLQAVASHHFELTSFDVKTAFLRGEGDGRQLGIETPPEMRRVLGPKNDEVCELLDRTFGTKTSRRNFFASASNNNP